MMDFDGYRIEVRPAEGEYVAFLLEVPTINAYGASPQEAVVALGEAYEAVTHVMAERGLPLPAPVDERTFSGRFNVRISPDLHRELVLYAKREGLNLNSAVGALLAQGVAGRREQMYAQTEAAEIESALAAHDKVEEAAVVRRANPMLGSRPYAYVTLRAGEEQSDELAAELVEWVREEIGPIASPHIQWAHGLPKTRSGRIMRRALRKIVENDYGGVGDSSTLADPGVVDELIENRMNRG